MLETRSEQTYVRHHIKKLLAFLVAMRKFASWLAENGHVIEYRKITDAATLPTITENLRALVAQYQINKVEYQEPDEYRVQQELDSFSSTIHVPVRSVSSEHFFTQRDTLTTQMGTRHHYLMEFFYRSLRKHTGYLMTPDGKPVGGNWNYDHENRHGPPKQAISWPRPPAFGNDFTQVARDILQAGIPYFGRGDGLDFPATRAQALQLLTHFCENALPLFGTYQDAMLAIQPYGFHSLLSFALNIKLISPKEVIERAIHYYHTYQQRISLQQIEGFVRQILGWREYMRGIYWALMPDYAETNVLVAANPLPRFYWTAETHMNCVAITVNQSLQNAYAHHIQRLMVTGNLATLLGVRPADINAWYLGVYADAIEWVQLPNTHGMSQWADGGRVATKPYVSSGAYINRMSDYCNGCYYDVKQKTGPRACPFNALYWHFLARHENIFASNPRMTQMYATLRKMNSSHKEALLLQGDAHIANADAL